jgi:putative sigma-54 modulation protein
MKILIEPVHFTADDSLIDYINNKVEKLGQFYEKIVDATVTLKLENSEQVKDKVVEVLLNVPGDSIFSSDTNKTFEEGIDKVTDTLKRQLIKRKEKQRSY